MMATNVEGCNSSPKVNMMATDVEGGQNRFTGDIGLLLEELSHYRTTEILNAMCLVVLKSL